MRRSSVDAVAVALLLGGAIRHLGWENSPEPALAWNAMGAMSVMLLLSLVMWKHWRAPVIAVVTWWAYEEALVLTCSTWRMFDWWYASPEEEMCSARLGFKLGAFSLVLIGFLICKVVTRERIADPG